MDVPRTGLLKKTNQESNSKYMLYPEIQNLMIWGGGGFRRENWGWGGGWVVGLFLFLCYPAALEMRYLPLSVYFDDLIVIPQENRKRRPQNIKRGYNLSSLHINQNKKLPQEVCLNFACSLHDVKSIRLKSTSADLRLCQGHYTFGKNSPKIKDCKNQLAILPSMGIS
jgi:hypothetical protein